MDDTDFDTAPQDSALSLETGKLQSLRHGTNHFKHLKFGEEKLSAELILPNCDFTQVPEQVRAALKDSALYCGFILNLSQKDYAFRHPPQQVCGYPIKALKPVFVKTWQGLQVQGWLIPRFDLYNSEHWENIFD